MTTTFLALILSVILEKTIRIPRSLSRRAATILQGFLNKNPVERLGCNRETGFMEIMTHPFFKTIEWDLVSPHAHGAID
jgi:atypical protein kinase C iota type